jgi:cation:H+ antiporter
MFGNIPVSREVLAFDLWVMVGAALLLAPFVLWRAKLNRIWGLVLTGLYVIYIFSILA